ncbi:MAG: Pyrroline-5-carboxylate reductase, partial [Candidatus Anoxychlamydiales bacterium]|nr:Pyrroline-5-carboxylate reductase [Candidatus Anoxychlamydiales bacterium]
MRIGVIGAGVMGSAMIKAFEGQTVLVCDKSLKKIEALGIKNGFTDPGEMISQVDVVVFAVRPQSFKLLAESIKIDMADKTVVSVMAGISIAQLQAATGSKTIIRCMPNLAMKVGKGVTAWTTT